MASGVPVAAYPVSGPEDVVRDGVTGCLDEDLGKAIRHAFHLDRDACRAHALARSWEAATRQFLGHLAINGPAGQEGLAGEIAASR
jgi:glycosyltransferase involved in cell wall biosynthesis